MAGIAFTFPPTVFSSTNTAEEQIRHFLSEAEEVEKAEDDLHRDEEMMDCLHSLETYFRILASDWGEKYVEDLVEKVRAKNAERGYYQKQYHHRRAK